LEFMSRKKMYSAQIWSCVSLMTVTTYVYDPKQKNPKTGNFKKTHTNFIPLDT